MGARSLESIARRAAKRGRTVEEQKAADRKDEHKAALRRQAAAREATAQEAAAQEASALDAGAPASQPSAAAATYGSSQREGALSLAVGVPFYKLPPEKRAALAADGKLKKDAKKGWVCMGIPGQVCGELNFAYRQTCRACGAQVIVSAPKQRAELGATAEPHATPASTPRASTTRTRPELTPLQVEKAAAAAAAAGETESKCFRCGEVGHWARHCTADRASSSQRAKRAGLKPPSDPTRAWEGTNATGSAEANAALRAKHAADPEQLSAEERARAEALLARDARKAAKRNALKAAKTIAKSIRSGGQRGLVLSTVKGTVPSI